MRRATLIRSVRVLLCGLLLGAAACAGDSGNNEGGIMQLPKSCTVEGEPVLGTYGAGSLESLAEAKAAGMNLVIGGGDLLDPETPTGAFCRENGIRVMYHLTGHIYGKPHLSHAMTAGQDTIGIVQWDGPLPDSGVVQIDGERILYDGYTSTALLACERGADGTNPAPHHENTILFWPECAAEDVARVKDSPNLWGYYVLDDSPGDALSALRGLYRVIKRVDEKNRPVCAGFGGPTVVHNFADGVCDLLLLYHYPFFEDEYDRTYISLDVQYVLTECRRRVPGIPFIGVYQAFWGIPSWTSDVLTPEQIRVQMEDFVREGASGLIAFSAMSAARGSQWDGWNTQESLIGAIREAHDEIRATGGLRVSPEPDTMARVRIQPVGHWEHPRELTGVATAWHLIGPFDDPEGAVLGAVHPPEREIDLAAEYAGKYGPVRWTAERHTELLDIIQHVGGHARPPEEGRGYLDSALVYATCAVTSPTERRGQMRVGSDDDGVVWFDGREVWRHEGSRGFVRDDDIVPVILPAGTTRILAKVYNRLGNCAFFMRFTDERGRPMQGLEFSPGIE